MDGAGVLYDNRDPLHVAALVDAVASDRALAEAIVDGQRGALDRLRRRDFAGTLLRFVDEALAAPRHPPARLTFDFWDQFTAYERLKEMQQYRPAIFQALPANPECGIRNSE
jgi:hypothetical protein